MNALESRLRSIYTKQEESLTARCNQLADDYKANIEAKSPRTRSTSASRIEKN